MERDPTTQQPENPAPEAPREGELADAQLDQMAGGLDRQIDRLDRQIDRLEGPLD
jgi:hypothetical protein